MTTATREATTTTTIETESPLSVSELISLNDGTFLSCSQDKTVKRWSVADGSLLKCYAHDHGVLSVTQLDQDTIATITFHGDISLWKLSSGVCIGTVKNKRCLKCIIKL